jgi:hypothetical protein
MIECPFEYHLTDDELRKLGEMSLTWSHTEDVIGNCLKALLRFNDQEALDLIFPLGLEQRMRWLKGLKDRMNEDATWALNELELILKGLHSVRNNVIHGTIIQDTRDGPLFHLKSKDRVVTKDDLFECEEFTNYCAAVAHRLRTALRFPLDASVPSTFLERPAIPKALREYIPSGKKEAQPPRSQPRPFQE